MKKPCLIPQRKHKVIEENRIHYQVDGEDDDTELYDSVTLFQRLLRGRAYQTMVYIKNLIIIYCRSGNIIMVLIVNYYR